MSSRVEQEFQEYDEGGVWMEVYRRIKNEASLNTLDDSFSVSHARSPHNRQKNRYRDVSPYDHSRVLLQKEEPDEDYINASFVEVPEANRKYILSQGPLDNTCGDFWLMVWQQRTKAVVMLNRVIEKGTWKCAQYWPEGVDADGEDEMIFDDVGLRVSIQGEQDSNHYTTRFLCLEDMASGEKRDVLHFQYTTWPDFGVPSSPTSFLNFLKVVRDRGSLQPDVGPAIVHCSAGIGRSGTFCLVDSCLVLVEKQKSLECIDMRQMLISMRTYRMGLIQTPDQLRFSYLSVIQGSRVLLGQDANSNITSQDDEEDLADLPDEVPPPPPARVSSLPEYTRSLPVVEDSDDDEENIDDQLAALIDDDDEEPPALPPKRRPPPTEYERMVSEENKDAEENAYEVRRRIREDRRKSTQEKIKNMKERQKKSEAWKNRRSYIQPIGIGLALLIGSYLVYRFYLKY